MQRFEALAPVVGAARGLAVDGDQIVPGRPHRPDPIFETTREGQRIDPVHQSAQPALARDAVVERREPPQKIQMILAPGGDFVEIVARGDGGAGQQQQDFSHGKAIRQASRSSESRANWFNSRATRDLGTSASAKKSAVSSIWRLPPIRGADRIILLRQGQIGVNLSSQP